MQNRYTLVLLFLILAVVFSIALAYSNISIQTFDFILAVIYMLIPMIAITRTIMLRPQLTTTNFIIQIIAILVLIIVALLTLLRPDIKTNFVFEIAIIAWALAGLKKFRKFNKDL